MRTCSYCGAEYDDSVLVCPIDQNPLSGVNFDPLDTSEKRPASKRWIKIGAASLAFLPMVILLLPLQQIASESFAKPIVTSCIIFNYPAFSLLSLVKTFNVSHLVFELSLFGLMTLWSSFVAWFFWKVAGIFQGEDEPEAARGQYDWTGFWVRFVIGFVVGFLFGWRFVKNTTSMKTVLIACLVTGFICGFLYGLSRPPDFWSRS